MSEFIPHVQNYPFDGIYVSLFIVMEFKFVYFFLTKSKNVIMSKSAFMEPKSKKGLKIDVFY